MKLVEQLGRIIEERWQAVGYAREPFPAIAEDALADARLHEHLSPTDILEWALTTSQLPRQADPRAKFGQPPLTLYVGRSFYIDALFWVDGTTTVHQHAFSGAFQVLSGSSLHTAYTFEPTRQLNDAIATGQLTENTSSLLRVGDIKPIHGGRSFIHSLFHLDRPSVSLVVRTFVDRGSRPQYDYLYPGLAFDPICEEHWAVRQLQLVEHLFKTGHPRSEELTNALLDRSDPYMSFRALRAVHTQSDSPCFDRLLARVRERDSAFGDLLRDVFVECNRTEIIVARRALITKTEHRFFLGVLMNVRRRAEILRLVLQFRPEIAAADTVIRWLDELSKTTIKLQVGGMPWEPSVVGLPQLSAGVLQGLRAHLDGTTHAGANREVDTTIDLLSRSAVFKLLFERELV